MGDTTAPDSTAPQVRIGDTERHAADDRLMAAVGEGVLTLTEYDERSLALWQARTRAELDALVADLPTPAAALARPPAAAPAADVPSRRGQGPGCRTRGALARTRSRVVGFAVPLAVLAGVLAAGPDSAAVFGSNVERVSTGQVRASVLFGSVTVVVPDGTRVDTSGVVVFGSLDCEAACSSVFSGYDDTGEVVEVRAVGGFGSVEVLTESEYLAEQDAERREELRDEREDDED